jgi:hypothetical protein
MSALRLYVGNRLTGIAVIPDEGWPGMWRVRTPDERVSDMVNMARAKDGGMAALARANGRGLRPGEVARWRTGGGRNAAPYSGSNENSGLGIPTPSPTVLAGNSPAIPQLQRGATGLKSGPPHDSQPRDPSPRVRLAAGRRRLLIAHGGRPQHMDEALKRPKRKVA